LHDIAKLNSFVVGKFIFSFQKIIFAGIIASALTLPYLWFILPSYILSNYYIYVGEILVVIVESFIYKQLLELKFNHALIISFVCHLSSFIFNLG